MAISALTRQSCCPDKPGDYSVAIFLNPNTVSPPSGQTAFYDDRYSHGRVLQAFIREQELLLPAVVDTKLHNETIDYLRSLANSYNEQLRIYTFKEALQRSALTVAVICAENS
jgi:hypothetical protein